MRLPPTAFRSLVSETKDPAAVGPSTIFPNLRSAVRAPVGAAPSRAKCDTRLTLRRSRAGLQGSLNCTPSPLPAPGRHPIQEAHIE